MVGYAQKSADSDEEGSGCEDGEDSWEDDDVDPGEMQGVEGMIFQSLELLATLVQRPNV